MSTVSSVITFSPTIESIIKSNKLNVGISNNIPEESDTVFDRASQNFAENKPKVYFVCEYIVEGKFLGVLVGFNYYQNATHYEIFKRNIFSENSYFDRILFLDTSSLVEETSNYIDYLKNVGIAIDRSRHAVIFDPIIKSDRIYEYKVTASLSPATVEQLDYDFIMKSKNLTTISVNNNGFNLSKTTISGWVTALLNSEIDFFGRSSLVTKQSVLLPSNYSSVMEITKEAYNVFGEKNTLLKIARTIGGLNVEFIDFFSSSIDEKNNVFSYDEFTNLVSNFSPLFKSLLKISQSNTDFATSRLANISILIPQTRGTESYMSLEGITKIFGFINTIYVSLLRSQDPGIPEEIASILIELERPKVNLPSSLPIFESPSKISTPIDRSPSPITENTRVPGASTITNVGSINKKIIY